MNIEDLLTRCSICFENQLDFCISYTLVYRSACKDQFCEICWERYVAETVSQSWGLQECKICCPVCLIEIENDEWQSYVDQDIIEQYNKFNYPWRGISRICNCSEEIFAVSIPIQDKIQRKCLGETIYSLIEAVVAHDGELEARALEILSRYKAQLSIHFRGGVAQIYNIYKSLMFDLMKYIDKKGEVAQISLKMITMECNSEHWKTLQFRHVSQFPSQICKKCNTSICMKCGVSPFHELLTCWENMVALVEGKQGSSDLLDLKWKLNNCRPCPNCSVMISRDAGCNKVECLFCGFAFCYNCLSTFDGGKCSYYRCQITPLDQHSESITEITQTENGIPDMTAIHARLEAH